MENMNLLDLGDDILNIIGGYVKQDNIDRMQKEKKDNIDRMEQAKKEKYYRRKDEESKKWIFKYVDEKVKGLKRDFDIKDKPSVIIFVYHFFGDCGIGRRENSMIEEYLTLKN